MLSSGNYFTGIAHQWAVVCAEQISLVKIAAIAFSDPLGWRRTERLFLFKVAGKASINGKRFRVSIAASTHDTRTGAGHWPEPGFWEMMKFDDPQEEERDGPQIGLSRAGPEGSEGDE